MVCNYSSVQREIKAHEVLSKATESEAAGKQHVRQALDHFELSQDDRNYHFLIHEPLGVTLQLFLEYSRGSLPIEFVWHVTYRMLYVGIYSWCPGHSRRSSSSFATLRPLIYPWALDLQARNILLRIEDPAVLRDAEEDEPKRA